MAKPATKKTRAPLTETEKAQRVAAKRANFVKLAGKRVSAAIDKVRLVGNLANRQTYTFTQADVDKMIDAMNDAFNAVESAFKAALAGGPAKSSGASFSLDDKPAEPSTEPSK